jgi:hypothetical protein
VRGREDIKVFIKGYIKVYIKVFSKILRTRETVLRTAFASRRKRKDDGGRSVPRSPARSCWPIEAEAERAANQSQAQTPSWRLPSV